MKIWMITGASSGIGKGIAEAALKHGDSVVVTARKKEHIMDFGAEYSDRVLKVSLELTNDDRRTSVFRTHFYDDSLKGTAIKIHYPRRLLLGTDAVDFAKKTVSDASCRN